MKQTTKTSRLAGQLEKIFRMINADFFDGELEEPIITIQSTPRAYGHYTLYNAWSVKGEGKREINIGAGTLDRPIEHILATLIHEMCHYWNDVNGIQDCSNRGVYHNKRFKETAEAHGLIIQKHEKYGWCITHPSDELIEWIIENDIQDILISRNEGLGLRIGGGDNAGNGGTPTKPKKTSSTRKYICPCCGSSFRATRELRVLCMDCDVQYVLA